MSSTAQQIREQTMRPLRELGFVTTDWLPLPAEPGVEGEKKPPGGVVRPAEEIAARFLALLATFAWASAPDELSPVVQSLMAENQLRNVMTPEEQVIVDTPKAEAVDEYQETVGWRLENMWPLAWALQLSPTPVITGGMINPEVTESIVHVFLPDFSVTISGLVEQSTLRTADEIVPLHDLFYCAHNAVRSAQLGRETVPQDFDPMLDGGCVHERRHSLTWMLSPGVKWEETDLST